MDTLKRPPTLSSPESSASSLLTTNSNSYSTISSPLCRLRLDIKNDIFDAASSSSSSTTTTTTTTTTKTTTTTTTKTTTTKTTSSSTSSRKKQDLSNLNPTLSNMSQILGIKHNSSERSKMLNALNSGKRINFAINFYLRDLYSSSSSSSSSSSIPKTSSLSTSSSTSSSSSITKLLDDLSIDIINDIENDDNKSKSKEFPIEIIEYIAMFLEVTGVIIWSSINHTHRRFCLESDELWSRFLLESNYCCEYIDSNDNIDNHYLQILKGKTLNEYDIIQAKKDNDILSVIKLEDHLDHFIVKSFNDGNENRYLYNLFKICQYFFQHKVCTSCWATNAIVPYIYGFPSDILMKNHKKLYIMNGDYIFDSSPIFCCVSCNEEYFSSPHHVCNLEVVSEELLFVCF